VPGSARGAVAAAARALEPIGAQGPPCRGRKCGELLLGCDDASWGVGVGRKASARLAAFTSKGMPNSARTTRVATGQVERKVEMDGDGLGLLASSLNSRSHACCCASRCSSSARRPNSSGCSPNTEMPGARPPGLAGRHVSRFEACCHPLPPGVGSDALFVAAPVRPVPRGAFPSRARTAAAPHRMG
jgi:hypothetical protein